MTPREDGTGSDSGRNLVFFVDDQQLVREQLAKQAAIHLTEPHRLEIRTFDNTTAAKAAILSQKERIATLVLDVRLSRDNMEGFELFEQLRSECKEVAARVVFFTAYEKQLRPHLDPAWKFPARRVVSKTAHATATLMRVIAEVALG